MKANAYESPVGISVWKGDWEDAEWTITGFPNKEFTVKDFDSAYDFEEFIQKKIKCNDITFDSEYCQFFAYAKTKSRAISFVKAIDKYFIKVKKMLSAE